MPNPTAPPAPHLDTAWTTALEPLLGAATGTVALGRGWDLDREREAWRRSAERDEEHLSVRLEDDGVLIGPRWVPGTSAGCPGCAEVRARSAADHPLVEDLARPCVAPAPASPALPEIVAAAAAALAERPLRPGELLAVGVRATRRHRVPRSAACPVCSPPVTSPSPEQPPDPLVLSSRPAPHHAPTRGAGSGALLRPGALRDRVVDPRFGPVLHVQRESRAPFAMSMAIVPESPGWGYGRAGTFGDAEPVALLEGFERLAGFPVDTPVLVGRSYDEVRERALDPASLGRYTAEQLASPLCRVQPSDASTPLDWVWGHDLTGGEAVLVPADVGFYQYEYRHRSARRAARRAAPHDRRHYVHESSSGCALGTSLEEAALHSLLELAERDAFLLGWHRAVPLPVVDPATVTDPVSRRLLDLVAARGFDAHLLVATQDVDLPVVWALALNRERPYPATFSAAGSSVDPAGAVRSALWELAQVVSDPVVEDRSRWEPMVEDPWLVDTLEDHLHLYTLPELRDRVGAVVGGPTLALPDAWPDWPGQVQRAARGDVRGALEHVLHLFADAGMDRVVLVDQSSREHADLGLAVAKAVVPGVVPMCFGQAQQRLTGLPRLTAALAGTAQADRPAPYDPHPFP